MAIRKISFVQVVAPPLFLGSERGENLPPKKKVGTRVEEFID